MGRPGRQNTPETLFPGKQWQLAKIFSVKREEIKPKEPRFMPALHRRSEHRSTMMVGHG
jgi:hypothetical protein